MSCADWKRSSGSFPGNAERCAQARRDPAAGFRQIRRALPQIALMVSAAVSRGMPAPDGISYQDCAEADKSERWFRRLSSHLLRRHVARRPNTTPASVGAIWLRRPAFRLRELRQSEVQDLYPAARVTKMFSGLRVAMRQCLFSCAAAQPMPSAPRTRCFAHRQRPAGKGAAQGSRSRQFRDDLVMARLPCADVVDGKDVGWFSAATQRVLAPKRRSRQVGRERHRKNFDSDIASSRGSRAR